MFVLPVWMQGKSMARYNAKDCIKYNTDVKREDEEILTEEGEIFYSKVKTYDDIQKNIQKQRNIFTYGKNKVKSKYLRKLYLRLKRN